MATASSGSFPNISNTVVIWHQVIVTSLRQDEDLAGYTMLRNWRGRDFNMAMHLINTKFSLLKKYKSSYHETNAQIPQKCKITSIDIQNPDITFILSPTVSKQDVKGVKCLTSSKIYDSTCKPQENENNRRMDIMKIGIKT